MKTIKKTDSIDLAPWKAKGGEQLPFVPPHSPPRRVVAGGLDWR
eukprot:COSAG02_NODE_2743_length_8115_cov_5.631487_8_plen_44_part_00